MAASDYTDICARFIDPLPAETLANFIASQGVPSDVVDVWDSVRAERTAFVCSEAGSPG